MKAVDWPFTTLEVPKTTQAVNVLTPMGEDIYRMRHWLKRVVPDKPGLGIELNPKMITDHLIEGEANVAPTPEWNEERSWDRLWS